MEENENTVITYENVGDLIQNWECSYIDFFKTNILEVLQSKLCSDEKGKYQNLTIKDVDDIAENLLESDIFFDELDKFILDELEYKINK